ncbi:MAG: extensin family protein, partial [Methylobacteriaceae bacterium]|nr:extensin family protein [Methylobacteriaceae bacterium]
MTRSRWLAAALCLASVAGEAAPRGASKTIAPPARFDGWVGVEPRRWPQDPLAPAKADAPPGPDAATCRDELARAGVEAVSADPPPAAIAACAIVEPVRLRAASTAQGTVRIAGEPLVACAFAARFGAYLREIAAPLAAGGAGAALAAVEAGGGYECRPRNRVAVAKISAHGQGLALDVAAFRLADGRRIAVVGAT